MPVEVFKAGSGAGGLGAVPEIFEKFEGAFFLLLNNPTVFPRPYDIATILHSSDSIRPEGKTLEVKLTRSGAQEVVEW